MPTNLYGPNDNFDLDNSHVLPALIRKFVDATHMDMKAVTLWGTGSAIREFLYVEDLAHAIMFCTENYDSDDHINIGTGKGISIRELAGKIAEITGFNGEIVWDKSKPDGMPVKVLDVERINRLGWKSTISFEDGLKKTINWYKENHQNG